MKNKFKIPQIKIVEVEEEEIELVTCPDCGGAVGVSYDTSPTGRIEKIYECKGCGNTWT